MGYFCAMFGGLAMSSSVQRRRCRVMTIASLEHGWRSAVARPQPA